MYAIVWWLWTPPREVITLWTLVTWLAFAVALLQILAFLRVPRTSTGRDLCSLLMVYVILLFWFSTIYYQYRDDFAIPSLSEVDLATSRLSEIERLQSQDWYKQAEKDYHTLLGFWKDVLRPANVATTMTPLDCPSEFPAGRQPPPLDCLRIAERNTVLAEKIRLEADVERSSFLHVLYSATGDAGGLSPRTPRGKLLVIVQRLTLFPF